MDLKGYLKGQSSKAFKDATPIAEQPLTPLSYGRYQISPFVDDKARIHLDIELRGGRWVSDKSAMEGLSELSKKLKARGLDVQGGHPGGEFWVTDKSPKNPALGTLDYTTDYPNSVAEGVVSKSRLIVLNIGTNGKTPEDAMKGIEDAYKAVQQEQVMKLQPVTPTPAPR